MARSFSGPLAVAMMMLLAVAGHAGRTGDGALTDSVVELERAVGALSSPAADYRTVLQGVVSAWPPNRQPFVKADLATFLSRTPSPGADFKCDADFVRSRARRELLRLKDLLLDENPQPAHAQFCYAVPFAIDPAHPPATVEIYGYDFDREPPEVLLMNSYGFRDVTFAVVRRAHYHLTLELQKNGVTFSAEHRRVAVTMGHLIQHAIPVIQADTSLCESRVEETPAGKTIGFTPPLVERGHASSGARATILANAALDFESNQVDATVCTTAVEQDENRSARSGCAVELVHSSDSDREIEGMIGSLSDRISYTSSGSRADSSKGTARGPLMQWIFAGFGGQLPSASDPRVTIQLGAARLISTKTDGCISAIAYMEAKRVHALSKVIMRRLDLQLRNIDPAVLRVRPRFAPS